jgi:hypothetical protein
MRQPRSSGVSGWGARSGGRDLTTTFLSGAAGPRLACAWSSEQAGIPLGRIRKGQVLRCRPPGRDRGDRWRAIRSVREIAIAVVA